MADISWDDEHDRLRVNTTRVVGMPDSVEYDDQYQTSLSEERLAKVTKVLDALYPGAEHSVVGAPWDYDQSEAPDLHAGTAIGHYRVLLDGNYEAVLCINLNDPTEGTSLGAQFFNKLRDAFVLTQGPSALANGKYVQEVDGVFAHIEQYDPNASTLANGLLKGRQYQLGTLIGQITNMGPEVRLKDLLLHNQLQEVSRDTTQRSFDRGYEMLQALDSLSASVNEVLGAIGPSTMSDTDISRNLIDMGNILRALPKKMGADDRYTAGTGNITGRTIVDYGDEQFAINAYSSVAQGSMPPITENTTYDFGSAVASIVTDPKHYDMDDEDELSLEDGLQRFINGYNKETDATATIPEAIEAAKIATVFNFVRDLGHSNLAQDGVFETTEDMSKHVATNVLPVMARLNAMAPF